MRKSMAVLFCCAALSGAMPLALSSASGEEGKEKEVSLDEIPAAARKGLLREAAGVPIEKVELETARGKTVYEGQVRKGSDAIGIVVDADGKLVGKHSEKDESKHRE
jgi:uncharacterized membrane protein YkoI